MALLLGTTRSDVILGLFEDDTIFGDPYTEGNFNGFPGNGAILLSGRGGNDRIDGGDGTDYCRWGCRADQGHWARRQRSPHRWTRRAE